MMRTTLALSILAGTLAVFTAEGFGEPVTFYDGTFDNDNWSATVFYTQGQGGSVESWQEMTGGNPGEFKRVRIHLNSGGPGKVHIFFHKTGAVYDPQSQGAIASIDYLEDAVEFANSQATGPAVRQNGLTYRCSAVVSNQETWTEHSWTGLSAPDFYLYDDPSAHPDFSSMGPSIEVGFRRANSTPGAGGYWTDNGIDNWTFTVHPVPEPATMSLLALGGLALLRRTQKKVES